MRVELISVERVEVFTGKLNGGREITLNITAMREATKTRAAMRINMPPAAHGVEPERLASLRQSMTARVAPIIVAMIEGQAFLVDGNHRVALGHEAKWISIMAHIFNEDEWPRFKLDMPKEITDAMLAEGVEWKP